MTPYQNACKGRDDGWGDTRYYASALDERKECPQLAKRHGHKPTDECVEDKMRRT